MPESWMCNFAAAKPGQYGIPPRKPNGGLYTGEAFAGDWGNVPVRPDAGHISAQRMFHASMLPWSRPGNDSPQAPAPGQAVHFTDLVATFPRRSVHRETHAKSKPVPVQDP